MIKNTTVNVVIKNPDGSQMTVRIEDVTDPDLKKELEDIKACPKLIVNGPLVKKI